MISKGLGDLQKEEKRRLDMPLLCIVTESTIAYVNERGEAILEPCLVLCADRSPLYAEEGNADWRKRIEWYADKLAKAFRQVRVHVTYAKVETRVLEA